jgi:hypothetical protein
MATVRGEIETVLSTIAIVPSTIKIVPSTFSESAQHRQKTR